MEGRGPRFRSEEIEVEIDGQRYRGERHVTGRHELHQVICFEALRERDPNDYEPDDEPLMRDVARQLLRELVEQARGAGRTAPHKVEPTPTPEQERGES